MQILLRVVILARDDSKGMVLRSRQISATHEPVDATYRCVPRTLHRHFYQCENLPCKLSQAKQRKFIRLHKLYLLDVDPEIIDLTIDEPVPSSSSVNTPEKTPKKRQRDPDVVEVDSL